MSKIVCSKCGEMTVTISNIREFKYKCTSCEDVYIPEGKDTIIMSKDIKDIPVGIKIANACIAKNPVNPIEKNKVCDFCGEKNTTRYVVQMTPQEAIINYQCLACFKFSRK